MRLLMRGRKDNVLVMWSEMHRGMMHRRMCASQSKNRNCRCRNE